MLLLRLVLVVALPLAALAAWGLYETAREDQRRAHEQVFHLAQVTASQTAVFLGQTSNILNGLVARPAVRALDPARCDPILKDFLGLAPRFANVATMALDATVVCSAVPLTWPARGNPERFIKLLRGPDQLTVGKPAPGVITGRWVLPVGRPLLDARGEVAGAVVLPLDLQNLPVLPSVTGLPERAVVSLIDGEGTVLASSSEAQRFVGTKAGAGRTAQREKSGTAQVTGIDGIARIQGFVPVPGTDWVAVASIPASAVYAGLVVRIAKSALAGLAVLIGALLLAVRWSRRIHDPIAAVARAAGEVAAGNVAARAPVTGAAEIADVAAQFNRMLDTRALAESERRAAAERFEKVFRAAPLPMTFSSEANGMLLDVNDAFCALFGYAREEAIGHTSVELGLWADPADRQAITERLRTAGRQRDIEARRRTRSGEVRDVVINTDRIELDGSPCVLATLYDITARRAAERELREARERFEKLFQVAPLPGVVSTLGEGRLVEVNEAYCALVGQTRDALIGRSALDFGIWSDPAARAAMVERVKLRQRVKDTEVHVRASTGEIRDVLISVERIDFFGEPCMLQIGADITERKRAEQVLRELIDNLFSFVGVLTPEGLVIEANRTALRAADLRTEDVLGKPVEDSYWVSFSEASRAGIREVVRRAAAGESVRQDLEIRIAQGGLITIDFSLVPVREHGGRVTKLVASGVDISERKRTEVGLRQAQQLAKLGYAVTRSDSAIESPSDTLAQLIGVAPGQVPKTVREWLTLLHPEDRELFRDKAIEAAKRGTRWDIEYRLRRGDGTWVDFRHVIEPLEGAADAAGRTRWFNMVQDVTEQKRAAAALRESQARLEALTRRLLEVQESERRFLARELHDEVGGLLTAVKLNLQSLRGKQSCVAAEAAIADGLGLVDGAIQAVRSLSLELRPAVLDDLGLIPALKWYCERQAERAGLQIELTLEAIDLKGAPELESACYRIVQEAMTNVLRHAKARRIQVTLRRTDGSFVLEIVDDGAGFDVAAARERNRAGEASGLLGMEERTALLGGQFRIESVPGAGSRVWVKFAVPDGGFG